MGATAPGLWEAAASFNPLEVLRRYLDDRHRRRQDRQYRETAERRRLELENMLLEDQVLRERISMARELGLPNAYMTVIARQFASGPIPAPRAPYSNGPGPPTPGGGQLPRPLSGVLGLPHA